MVVIQIPVEVPPEIYEGLLSGELTRFGTVVRDASGIVAHLKDAALPQAEINRLVEIAKAKALPIGIGAGIVVFGAVAGIAYVQVRKRNARRALEATPQAVEPPRSMRAFDETMRDYLARVQRGDVTIESLGALRGAIDLLRSAEEDSDLTIAFSTEEAAALLAVVREFTKNLLAANGLESEDDEPLSEEVETAALTQLRHELDVQHRVFGQAA